jgi:hypothetical protein
LDRMGGGGLGSQRGEAESKEQKKTQVVHSGEITRGGRVAFVGRGGWR